MSMANVSTRSAGSDWTPARQSQLQIGLWIFLGTATMLFGAFGSAYIVRRATGAWQPVSFPTLLWFNTACLIFSSVALEVARMRGRKDAWPGARQAFLIAIALGLVFVGGQFLVWRDLVAQQIYVHSGAHGAFFYILTGLHAVHLAAGLIFMAVTALRIRETSSGMTAPQRLGLLRLCATFWHFFALVWLYLFAMLTFF